MKEVNTVAKTALAVLGMGMIAAMAALTVALGSGEQAHADNSHGGAGVTVTKSAAPTAIDTPAAAPTLKATPFGG